MTETVCPITNGLPVFREDPLSPPSILGRIRAERPICPMTFPDGHRGWLVTGHDLARAILIDPRFSSDGSQKHLAFPSDRAADFDLEGDMPPGMFEHMDPPEHTRYRRLLARQFTARRMRQLAPRIERIAAGHADAMARKGAPADLVRDYAVPLSSQVICELLGVPVADRDRFERGSDKLLSLDIGPEEAAAALGGVVGLLGELIARKRAEPEDDLLSGLVTADQLTDPELVGVALLLLVAGHETTANMLALGTCALLREPDQLAALRADESLIESAVEELLRYLTVVHIGVQRTPTEEVEIDGTVLRPGETVLIHLPSANRDPGRFAEPDRLDLARSGSGHLTFSYGMHQCLGQQLARIELRIGYLTLLRRFPELRLAEPLDTVPMRSNMTIYGVHRLPVTW